MMPVPAWPAAELVETIRTGRPMPDEAVLALLRAQGTPVRARELAEGLVRTRIISIEQQVLAWAK